MDTDLRFPEHLIASPHKELPMSLLPSQVGSMPGSPATSITENNLIAGRGVIPGSPGAEQLGHLFSKKYPNYDTYYGVGYDATIQFHSPRLEFLNSAIEWVAKSVIEAQIKSKGAVMLSMDMWVSEDWWGIIPTYRWSIVFRFYIPGVALGKERFHIAGLIVAGIVLLLAGIIIWKMLEKVVEIIHGYPPIPGEPRPPGLFSYIPWIVGGLGVVMLAPLITDKKPKKRKKKK